MRKDTDAKAYESAAHFDEIVGGAQMILTSTARQEAGLFELSFRDERCLPLEGTGVISRRRIELPREGIQFDARTVSDVIFHFLYTARDGGDALREVARMKLRRV